MRELRKNAGLTQVAAAELFGLKRQTYANYERRVTDPPFAMCSKMAVFFKCTIGELFDLKEGNERIKDTDDDALIDNFRKVNESGQKKIVDYSVDLVASGNYAEEGAKVDLQLKRIRKLRGLTQEDMAQRLDIKKSRYGTWEREERMMSFPQACSVADILECSLDELVGRDWPDRDQYLDSRQEALNGYFASLNEEGKDDLLKFAKSFAADPERRTVEDSTNTVADSVHVA